MYAVYLSIKTTNIKKGYHEKNNFVCVSFHSPNFIKNRHYTLSDEGDNLEYFSSLLVY